MKTCIYIHVYIYRVILYNIVDIANKDIATLNDVSNTIIFNILNILNPYITIEQIKAKSY